MPHYGKSSKNSHYSLSGRGRLKESGHTPNISLQIYETTSKPLDISLVTSLVCDLLLQFPVTVAGPHVTC